MGNGEAQNNDQNNNASQEKTWGEKYNEALEAQMKERSEVLNNCPLDDKELNEMLTRQRETMQKIISER